MKVELEFLVKDTYENYYKAVFIINDTLTVESNSVDKIEGWAKTLNLTKKELKKKIK